MSELQIFKNAEFGSVRTVMVEGEPVSLNLYHAF